MVDSSPGAAPGRSDSLTDDQIVLQVLEGDVEAFAVVVRRYQQEVWRIAAFALRDAAATEDLVQQVFVNVYFALPRFARGRELGPWLRTIARNEVRKALRQGTRDARKRRLLGAHLAAQLEAPTADADAEEAARRDALRRCRETLAAPAAEALQRRYEQQQGFEEIARALDRTVVAARQLLVRARLALRACIEKRMAAG